MVRGVGGVPTTVVRVTLDNEVRRLL